VFVEKPLALDDQELENVLAAAGDANGRLMVGFNRRFSPLAVAAKDFFGNRTTPLTISYRVNAGRAPADHWTNDPVDGGGSVRGEVCHFIDFFHYITGSLTERVFAESLSNAKSDLSNEDSIVIAIRLADGSNASIVYSKEGDRALPKERIEIIGGGKALVIDDFRTLTAYDSGKEKTTKLRKQDKGQENEIRAICEVVRNGKPVPITLEDLATTTRATFRIRESLRTGRPIEV
jgi:predicted dehydrogenase